MKIGAIKDQPVKRQRRKARKPYATLLAAHPIFAPLLGVWGAALAGLSILVLPAPLMVRASKGTGLVLLGDATQAILAVFAALVVGGAMFLVASQLTRKARRKGNTPSIVAIANRRVRTIDPARELGSLRLDDPVEAEPFAILAKKPEAAPDVSSEPDRVILPEPAPTMAPPPRALELGEFAQLPGREAVWVYDTVPASAPEPAAVAVTAAATEPPQPVAAQAIPIGTRAPAQQPTVPSAEHPSDAALVRLRETPAEQLSLAEMVERFAGALHEHRETAPSRPSTPQDIAAREAALAEALRALAALSGDIRPDAPQEPLADALTRLQGLRGAA